MRCSQRMSRCQLMGQVADTDGECRTVYLFLELWIIQVNDGMLRAGFCSLKIVLLPSPPKKIVEAKKWPSRVQPIPPTKIKPNLRLAREILVYRCQRLILNYLKCLKNVFAFLFIFSAFTKNPEIKKTRGSPGKLVIFELLTQQKISIFKFKLMDKLKNHSWNEAAARKRGFIIILISIVFDVLNPKQFS